MSSRIFFSDSEKLCVQELVRKHKLHQNTTLSGSPSATKYVWARLTQEYNSIFNSRRTESQLKRCWSNIKAKKKTTLNQEKKERLRTGGGPYTGPASSCVEGVEDALTASTDLELRFAIDCDTMLNETPADVLEFRPVDEVPAPAAQGPPDNNPTNLALANSQFFGKDVRAQVITKEFEVRAEYLKRNEEREEELHLLKAKKLKRNEEQEEQLHLLKMEEQKWLVKAAEEAYQKARLERLNAAQLLQFSEVTREEAEQKN